MSHTCPRPGCDRAVSDDMFACRPDWYALPEQIRADIWSGYRGEHADHAGAMVEAIKWYRAHPPRHRAARTPGETGDPL